MIAGGGPRKTGGSRAISPHQDLEILIWQEHPYCGAMEHIQAISRVFRCLRFGRLLLGPDYVFFGGGFGILKEEFKRISNSKPKLMTNVFVGIEFAFNQLYIL